MSPPTDGTVQSSHPIAHLLVVRKNVPIALTLARGARERIVLLLRRVTLVNSWTFRQRVSLSNNVRGELP